MIYKKWSADLPSFEEIEPILKQNYDGGFHVIDLYELKNCPLCGHSLPPEDFEDDECKECNRQWANGLLPTDTESIKGKAIIRLITRIKNPLRKRCSVDGCNEWGERHHLDYSNPDDIIRLCKKHHEALHKQLNHLKKALIAGGLD